MPASEGMQAIGWLVGCLIGRWVGDPQRIAFAKDKSDVLAKADGTYDKDKKKKKEEKGERPWDLLITTSVNFAHCAHVCVCVCVKT